MSIKVMTAVWELDLPPSEKLVLLALADWAQDDGRCWPSIAKVAAKSGVSERTVQRMLREAEKAGLLKRKENMGRGCEYTLPPDNLSPVTNETDTPDTVSPNTLGTTKSSEAKASSPRAKLSRPVGVSPEQWSAFKAQRKKPLNARSYVLLTNKLNALAEDGYPPGEMIDLAIERGWETVFKPFAQRENYNGGNHQHLGKSGQAFAMQGNLSDDRPF
jgi:hypothetical protein